MSEVEYEYRIVAKVDGAEHTIDTLGCWGPEQDYLTTSDARLERAIEKLADYRKYRRILSSVHSVTRQEDIWIEQREVSEWRKLAEGGVVPESYIRIEEEGSICPVPKASVTFEGQKLSFDAAEEQAHGRAGNRGGRMIDVREIKLNLRYPESRQEDITDAFTRGYTGAVEIGNKAIKKLEAENAKLRELVADMWRAGAFEPGACYVDEADRLEERTRKLGIEVDHG